MNKHTIKLPAVMFLAVSVMFLAALPGYAEPKTPRSMTLPLQAEGWEGVTVSRLCLKVEQSYPQIEDEFSQPIAETVQHVLDRIGVQVVDEGEPCDAALTFTVTLEATRRAYTPERVFAYTGASATGQLELAGDGWPTFSSLVSQNHPPPVIAFEALPKTPRDAPFGVVLSQVILGGFHKLWGMPIVTVALNDEMPPEMRLAAASVLEQIGDVRAVDPLIAAFKDKKWRVREKVAGVLRRIGEPAFEPLIAALKDKDQHVRERSAVALGRIGDARAVEPLITAFKDKKWRVREKVAGALGKIGDARAVEPLIAVLKDEVELVRRSAARALGNITEQDFGQDQAKWRDWWHEHKDNMLKSR